MTKALVPIFLVFSLTFFISCEEVIEVELQDSALKLVIDGEINNYDSIYPVQVTLSTTAPFYANGNSPRVSGATITLYEDSIPVEILSESPLFGYYRGATKGKVLSSYYLKIEVPNGKAGLEGGIYQTIPERINRPVPIDSIFTRYEEATLFTDEGYYAYFSTTDPVGVGDYYRWKNYNNGATGNDPFDIIIGEDRFIDGNTFEELSIHGYALEVGDIFMAEQISISKEFFEFLRLLQIQLQQSGSTFAPLPAPIVGNGYSVSKPNEDVLGYFSAVAIESASIVVTP